MPRLILLAVLVVVLGSCSEAPATDLAEPTDLTEPTPAAQAAELPAPSAAPLPEAPAPPAPPAVPGAPAVDVLPPGVTDEPALPGEPALLALGDSLAAGTGLTRLRDGFVWRVHRALGGVHEAPYGLANLAVPGATSADVLEVQLPAAEEQLAARAVDAVLVSAGGNDLLGLLRGPCREGLGTPTCLDAADEAVSAYAANLDAILERLAAAAPDATVVVLQPYNPFDLGLGSEAEQRAAEATTVLNAAAAEVARARGARLADGYATLAGRITATTGMGAAQPDIHPSAEGHQLLAAAILQALGTPR